MAPRLRLWIAAPLALCGVVALAYLPPRGGVTARESRFGPRMPQATPARLRAQALAEDWRAAQGAMQLLESERDLGSERTSRTGTSSSLTVQVNGPDSVVLLLRPLFTAQLDTVWRQLGLGATKVSVLVIVTTLNPRRSGVVEVMPTEERGGSATYLLPDSTNRTTCAVRIPATSWTLYFFRTRRLERIGQLREWLRGSLGPCAFYAAFGTPGKPVRQWMARRQFDLALHPGWDRPDSGSGVVWFWGGSPGRAHIYWELVYRYPTTTIACLAGRQVGCRAAVLDLADAAIGDAPERIVRPEFRGWWTAQRLIPGERLLSDVAREVGHERFRRFWNSTDPVDTALATALRMPVGEWTERWERRQTPRLILGAAAPASASLLALLLAGTAVISVAVTARRRQIR